MILLALVVGGIIVVITVGVLRNNHQSKFRDIDSNTITNSSNITGQADEITKYKKLLDNGLITEDEFDQKKKQLLNL